MSESTSHTDSGFQVRETTPLEPASTPQETSSPKLETQQPTAHETEGDKLRKVEELLAREMGHTPEEPEPEPEQDQADLGEVEPEPEEGPKTVSAKDLAEALGVDVSSVYNMEITTGDGEVVTVGALKDAYQTKAVAERESAERTASLDGREAQLIEAQHFWVRLAQSGHVPQEAMVAMREHMQEGQRREAEMLHRLAPELRDDAKLDNFRNEAVKALGKVGFAPHEVVMADHRHVLFVRRYLQMEKELKALRKDAKPKPPKAARPGGRGANASNVQAMVNKARGGTEADKLAAITALMNGG